MNAIKYLCSGKCNTIFAINGSIVILVTVIDWFWKKPRTALSLSQSVKAGSDTSVSTLIKITASQRSPGSDVLKREQQLLWREQEEVDVVGDMNEIVSEGNALRQSMFLSLFGLWIAMVRVRTQTSLRKCSHDWTPHWDMNSLRNHGHGQCILGQGHPWGAAELGGWHWQRKTNKMQEVMKKS